MEDPHQIGSGHRGNLTPSQTRDLLQLWHRFLQLCEDYPLPASQTHDSSSITTPDSSPSPALASTSTSRSPYLRSNLADRRDANTPLQTSTLSPPPDNVGLISQPSTAPSSANASGEKLPGGTEDDEQSRRSTNRSLNDLLLNPNQSNRREIALPNGGLHQQQRSASSRVNGSGSGPRGTLPRSASTNLGRAAASGVPTPHSHQPNSAALGRTIPRDDRVKDQVRGLEEAKELRNFLNHHGGIKLKKVFWSMVKGEHPDALLLRILRARKWDVDRALGVLGSTAAFRVENDVAGINFGGEEEITKTKGGANVYRNGIAYVWGSTAIGEPIYYIEVGNHFGSSQTQEELKKSIILSHEHLIDLMPPPIEKCIVVFNMNHFGLRNMDWWAVFFLVKTVEAYYPESLTRIYVHGAPWFFKPIWIILRPLLDPIVRDKVRLTSSVEELEEHIPWRHLPKNSMHGGMEWDYVYPEPEEDENHLLRDSVRREHLQASFDAVAAEFESTTRSLLNAYVRARTRIRNRGPQSSAAHSSSSRRRRPDPRSEELDLDSDADIDHEVIDDESDEELDGNDASTTPSTTRLLARRDVLATKLRVAWLELRPYIWGKSKYDRWGISREDGTIKWTYPAEDPADDEVQILGEGVSIPELKRGLEIIERSEQENNDLMIAEASGYSKASRRREASTGMSTGAPSSTGAALPTIARPSRASQKRSRIAATLAAAQAHPMSQNRHQETKEDDCSSFDENDAVDLNGNTDLTNAAAAAAGASNSNNHTSTDAAPISTLSDAADLTTGSPHLSNRSPLNGSSSDQAQTSASESTATARPLSSGEDQQSSNGVSPTDSTGDLNPEKEDHLEDKPLPVHPLEAARLAKADP